MVAKQRADPEAEQADNGSDDAAAVLAQLRKKIKKQTAAGNTERVEKLQKKLKKLEKQHEAEEAAAATPAAPATAEGTENGTKQAAEGKKKQKKRSLDATTAAEEQKQQPEAEQQGSKKKAKKQAAQQQADEGVIAEVGNAELARNGKPIVKALYKEHAEVSALTQEQVNAVYQERCITVEGSGIKPLLKFEHTGLPKNMLHATREFSQPSPIQAQCWPIILSGHDLIGIASTGSGKTLAFGLPALRHIEAQKAAGVVKGKGPVHGVHGAHARAGHADRDCAGGGGSQCNMKCACIYGGVPKREQVEALRKGVEIVVGTPGRLEDLMNEGSCKLNEVTYLVLDEADRMLDLGFEPHIRTICSHVRCDRQTTMFSATWPTAVQKLAASFLRSDAVKVTIGSQDLAASHTIKQVVEVIDHYARNERLLQLLQEHHSSRKNRIIIFVLYKKEAPQVEALLTRRGWKCGAIHGDISQGQRTAAVEAFKSGKVPLLIATDVAARGLDIPDVEVVINYSFPLTTEDYVHRIGRTGRAGKKGIAHTFFCAGMDKPRAGELINVLREAGQTVPEELLKFGTAVKKKESKLYGAHFKDFDPKAKATKTTFDSDED